MLGKYEVTGKLGRGAMGTVYEGWDPLIARRVAIKTVELPDTSDCDSREAVARFRREAQVAGRLAHPNIVGVFDYGETNNQHYIVMEYVDGLSLKTLLDKSGGIPLTDTLHIMSDVLAGLHFSHERGVVHRDLSPANVILTSSGQAKIVDFGIARIEGSWMTQAGTVLGTPSYMSPEQFMGQAVDARSDIYSAGVLFYQLLTGDRPFEGSMSAIMYKVLNTEPTAPSRLSMMVPPAYDAVVRQAMARRPEDRYPTSAAFAEAIEMATKRPRPVGRSSAAASAASGQALPSIPGSAPVAPEGSVAAPPDCRRVSLATIAAAAAGVIILAGGGSWWQWQTPGIAPVSEMSSAPAPVASQTQPQTVALNTLPTSSGDDSRTPQLVRASDESSGSPPPPPSQLQQTVEPSTAPSSPSDAAQTPQPAPVADGLSSPQAASSGSGQPDATVQEADTPDTGSAAAVASLTAGPVRLRATLLMPARPVTLERRVMVQELLTDHGLLPTTHAYMRTVYRLGTGESFGGASFQASNSNYASGVAMAYQPVPRAVTLSFSLRSGSFINPWPGSLSGVALVRVRRDEPKQEIELPDIALSLPGQASLKLAEPLTHRPQLAVRMRDPASGEVVEVPVGSTGVLDGHVLSIRFDGMTLMVTAQPI
nr:serine/threonine-protein kinase [uncultured Rhodopila sp.]